jgi:DNA polymerase-3 subunit gamma/tau
MNGSVGGNGRPVNPSASNPYQPKFSSTTAQTPQNGSIYNAPVHGATAQQASTSAYQRPANMTSPLSAPTGTAPAPELPKAAPAAPETAPTAGTTAAAQPTASPYRANDPAAPADTAQPAQPNPEATPRNRRAGQTSNNDDLYKPMT